jgi:hypothetical protein
MSEISKGNRGKLNKNDCVKLLRGVGVACAGAALTYFSEWASATDFGEYTPMVVATLAVFVNVIRKILTNTEPKPGEPDA